MLSDTITADLTPPAAVLARRDALKGQFIAGEWQRGQGAEYRHVYAANRAVMSLVPLASAAQVEQAVGAAVAACPGWKALDPDERGAFLLRLADLVIKHGSELGDLQILDTGFVHAMAHDLPNQMARWMRYYAGWGDKAAGSVISTTEPRGRWIVDREAYGVVGVMIPWNAPISGVCMKSMAALSAGNCVVVKSPEIAPFGMMRFAELVEQAGFPPGVISILSADAEGGQALCSDPRVAKLSFTGGAPTATKVLTAAAANVTPTLLELGGKSATIIFDDADLDRAVPFAIGMVVAGSGQICILSSRLLVQRAVYDEVVERAAAQFAALQPGDPFLPETSLGPVISDAAADRIVGVVRAAEGAGAGRLVSGGGQIGGRFAVGAYVQPALFVDVPPTSDLFQREVFGPVLSITPFDDEADAIRLANATRYGLYSYVYTSDLGRAMRTARSMKAGSVAVNGFAGVSPRAPFGGFGLSGYGKEGGREGLDEFLRSKAIFVAE